METAEALQRKIIASKDLYAVVRTMKALAAASIRQYEKALESLEWYTKTVDGGLRLALGANPEGAVRWPQPQDGQIAAIIFGSDQGMCGQFNQAVARFAVERLSKLMNNQRVAVFAVGYKIESLMQDADIPIVQRFPLPGSILGLTTMTNELRVAVEGLERQAPLAKVLVYHNRRERGELFHPIERVAFPVSISVDDQDPQVGSAEIGKESSTRCLPMTRIGWQRLMFGLMKQKLLISFSQAGVESLQSEHASRLAAMQAAEKNINERIDELGIRYGWVRQENITSELLDIVAGYEASH